MRPRPPRRSSWTAWKSDLKRQLELIDELRRETPLTPSQPEEPERVHRFTPPAGAADPPRRPEGAAEEAVSQPRL